MNVFIKVFALTVFISAVLVGVSMYTSQDNIKNQSIVQYVFTKKVEQYRPLVTQYAEQNNVENHVDVILAMMMQESGGRGDDPMQSSESLCGKVGCISEPEQSIKQGVYYFSKTLDAAEGNIELAIQSYNFGIGFVDYVKDKDEQYSQELAIAFSQVMYDKAEYQSIYSCRLVEAKQ